MKETLTQAERQQLLALARYSVAAAASQLPLPEIDPGQFSARLFEPGASFVTLTEANGDLRGCIGALEAYQPLVMDVREHAAAAAVDDYRFFPVQPDEVDDLHIEISRLTQPEVLEYQDPAELPGLLRPGVDGVILRDGIQRATFLPQVWEKLPDAERFLGHLCQKMGAPSNLWKRKKLLVQIYQVEEFHEK
jgi:uncharacterized protein